MSQLYVDNIRNRTGGAINAPSGAVVTGVTTATGLDINGNGDVSGNLNIGGVLTYEDVNNVDSVGVITARQGIRIGAGQSIGSDGAAVVYYGDGSNLDGVVSGVEVKQDTTSKGTSIVSLDFSGATVTASGAGSTISIAAGVNTTASSPSANSVVTLNLTDFGHHDITLSAGITTITCTGGSMGQSHSLVLTQPSSGIATVGFSTYFLFPSGSTPSMSEGGSKVDLLSFVIRTEGQTGIATQLLASAGLNYQ